MGKKASQRHSAYTVMQGVLSDHTNRGFKYSTREIDELQFISKYETLPAGPDGYQSGDVMGLISVLGPTKKQLLFGVGIVRQDKNGEPYLAETSVENKVDEAKRFIRDYKKYIEETPSPKIPNNGNEIAVILRKLQTTISQLEAQKTAASSETSTNDSTTVDSEAVESAGNESVGNESVGDDSATADSETEE